MSSRASEEKESGMNHPHLLSYKDKIERGLESFISENYHYIWGYVTKHNIIILRKYNTDDIYKRNFVFIHYCWADTLKKFIILSSKEMCLMEVADECLDLIDEVDAQLELVGKNTHIIMKKKEMKNFSN